MTTFQTGQLVKVRGTIRRSFTSADERDVERSLDEITERIWLGKPEGKPRYAFWIKDVGFPYQDSLQGIVLGYTWKKAGQQHPANDEMTLGLHNEDFWQYMPGYLDQEYSGMAWIVMPIGAQPNRYRKPITTIEEFMEEVAT